MKIPEINSPNPEIKEWVKDFFFNSSGDEYDSVIWRKETIKRKKVLIFLFLVQQKMLLPEVNWNLKELFEENKYYYILAWIKNIFNLDEKEISLDYIFIEQISWDQNRVNKLFKIIQSGIWEVFPSEFNNTAKFSIFLYKEKKLDGLISGII